MKGFPWIQFFPGDWVADTRLLTLSAKGAWIDIISTLHNSPTRGEMTMDIDGWARVIGSGAQETGQVIRELDLSGVANVDTLPDGKVTIGSRRMLREEMSRRSHAKRQKRYRERQQVSVTQASQRDASCRSGDAKSDADKTLFDMVMEKSDAEVTKKCRDRGQKPEAQIILAAVADEDVKKKTQGRKLLLDSLASLTCSNLAEVTDWGRHAKALKMIQVVTPEVTAEEICRRAAKYGRLHPTWELTSTALATHWGELGNGSNGSGNGIKPADIYTEPTGWREKAARKFPGITLPTNWGELSSTMRNDLISQ